MAEPRRPSSAPDPLIPIKTSVPIRPGTPLSYMSDKGVSPLGTPEVHNTMELQQLRQSFLKPTVFELPLSTVQSGGVPREHQTLLGDGYGGAAIGGAQFQLDGILQRVRSALERLDFCACLPPGHPGQEDRTLRRANPPEVTDCRVEPPPPQRRDPFIFRAKVGGMEELLIINLDQLDKDGRPQLVHQAKNGTNQIAELIIPDNNPIMPQAGDHLLILARKYTDQVVDGQNVVGPWSKPQVLRVQPPRDAQGNVVRGYAEDMRVPYFQAQHIDFCADGDLRAPGRRLFYSTQTFAVPPYSELRLSMNRGAPDREDWVELARTESSVLGTFCFDVRAPKGGVDGYKLEIIQAGQAKVVAFDPIRHAPFGTDPATVARGLVDELFSALPLDTTLCVSQQICRAGKYAMELTSPAIRCGDRVRLTNTVNGEVSVAEADHRAKVTIALKGSPEQLAHCEVEQNVEGKKIWVPLGTLKLGDGPRQIEGSTLPLVLGPEVGLKEGQRLRVINQETKAESIVTADCQGAALVLGNVSRGDVLSFALEDYQQNKRTWTELFAMQIDSARCPGEPREQHFTQTVDAPRNLDGWMKLARLFGTLEGKEVPVEHRRAFMFGAHFGQAIMRYYLRDAEAFGFEAGCGETLKWFKKGFELGRQDQRWEIPTRADGKPGADITPGHTFCDQIRVEERCTPSVRNISGLTGRFHYQTVQRRTPDTIRLPENPFGIRAKQVQAGGH